MLRGPVRGRWLAAAAIAVAVALVSALVPARAQETGTYSIRAAPVITAKPRSEISLAIEVGPPEAVLKDCFVTVRGLPPAVVLKEGHAVAPGWWAVPLSALATLTAEVPDGVSGRSEVVISLMALDGRLLAQARTALVIDPGTPEGAARKFAPVAPMAPPSLTEEQRAGAERSLARGEAHQANGNIMVARVFFERAVEAGLAAAALRLAATYDPVVLQRLKTQGVAPDVALARKWYERARELGAPEAAEALARLRD